ncbi:hypothetical protein NPS29_08080 [Pseudomonas putida]|jgi:hypothetical protein|uniref:hypothetical protein n=1 Tax=Pseudomonas putida TaxID=303 RepID=UPI0023648BBB|nr:hypothetical protein [Pseudomonas putida]MDD1965275.1 hypothetical protein [Pseudomonas putida]
MADYQPDAREVPQGSDLRGDVRRRKVMMGVGLLMGIVVLCVAAILLMLQRLEARNASFQPPMTALERQRLLPPDPVLDTAPQIQGLRYGEQPGLIGDDLVAPEVQHVSHGPLGQAPALEGGNLHADSAAGLQHASHLQ